MHGRQRPEGDRLLGDELLGGPVHRDDVEVHSVLRLGLQILWEEKHSSVNQQIKRGIEVWWRNPSSLEQEEVGVPVDEGSRPGDAGRGTAVARQLQEPDWIIV